MNISSSADITRLRLYSQHLSRPDLASPADVVRWFGAVQAQDLLGSLYGIGLRLPGATEATVESAVADRAIVRTWPMRGTIHFVPAEDAKWMLKLLAHRQTIKFASVYRKAGLTEEILNRARKVLRASLEGGVQLTRTELYEALDKAGISTSGTPVGMRGLHILGYWSQEGLICLGARRGKQATFALLDEWVLNPRLLEGDEAMAELARRYFRSHGPATLHDFAWWAGITVTEAKQAASLLDTSFVQESVDGKLYILSADTASASGAGTNAAGSQGAPVAYLLPPFDEFTVAYKDRSAFLDHDLTEEALHGIGSSVIVDGKLVGTWKRSLAKNRVTINISLLVSLSPHHEAEIAAACEHYGAFLGLPVSIE